MHDRFERAPVGFVGEDDSGKGRSIERPFSVDDLRPAAGDRRQPIGSGCDRLTGELIGVDDQRAPRRKPARDLALPRPDPPR
jgi:hypothetical protein